MTILGNLSYPQPLVSARGSAHPGPGLAAPGYVLGFLLFILVNAVLFMRPTEIFPDYLYAQTYLVLTLACLAVSLPTVWKQLATSSLAAQPITVCVLGLIVAIALSHLTRFAIDDAVVNAWEFAKIALYYLLLVGLVNTPGRLRQFLFWIVCFILVQAVMAVLAFHRVVDLRYFNPISEEQPGISLMKGAYQLLRLVGSGIFNNPNEFCYPTGAAIMVCLFFVNGRQAMVLRVFCLATMMFLGYAMSLTSSRGGFVGLLFGLVSFLLARFGWKKALPFAAMLLPVLFIVFGGRQTDLNISSGTGQGRIQLWNDGLVLFLRAPIFGLGTGLFREEVGYVTHNSYLQAYSELGFFGGTLFLGAFYLALSDLYRVGLHQGQVLDSEMQRLRPYLVGVIGGFMACMLTMSLTDMLPTYTMLGFVVAYLRVTAIRPPLPRLLRFNMGLVLRLVGVSAFALAFFLLYIRFTFVPG
jgi:hypothetical protein